MFDRSAHSRSKNDPLTQPLQSRLRLLSIGVIILVLVMVVRLFTMSVLQHDFYTALAAGTQDLYKDLLPNRGTIYIRNRDDPDDLYPLAMNRFVYQVFIDNRDNPEPNETTRGIAEVLGMDDDIRYGNYMKVKDSDPDDPYIPITEANRISEKQKEAIEERGLTGVYFARSPYRYFPEGSFASQVLGFYGLNSEGAPTGLYGAEGYYHEVLAGEQGFIEGKRDAFGAWIPTASRSHKAAQDGADIVLTIDRNIQFKACQILDDIAKEVEAASATSMILEPKTGKVMAMCNYPSFDPNVYNEVENVRVYNNDAIFTAYEPGSVFKTVTMAAALDDGAISPELTFEDPGSRYIDDFRIYNALRKNYGEVNMSYVLQKSINTGMIFVVEKLGKKNFAQYVRDFGFGERTGIALDTEVAGIISSLDKPGDIFAATGSFGQGLTTTPIQLAAAYGAMANGGVLMQPQIVEEVRYRDGTVHKVEPKKVREVISSHAAHLVTGMLTSVIEETYKVTAAVPGFYMGGKTGTAQIPGKGGYTEETNHSFVGYGPTEDPRFVIMVKFEKPQRKWAESTAAPYFGKMAKFLVQYLGIAPTR